MEVFSDKSPKRWAGCREAHLFTEREWHVLVLDHVSYLPFHCEDKEDNPVHKQDRPEDGDVEDGEEGHEEGNDESFRDGVPASMERDCQEPSKSTR